jgi:hypothetical protein
MSYLNNLTAKDIEQGVLPINDILANSLYYAACESDGGVVKDCNKLNSQLGIVNFIYADYAFGEERLNQELDTFHGFTVFAMRNLKQHELTPNNWQMQIPPGLTPAEYFRYSSQFKRPFAKWVVYERVPEKGEDFGPRRFSLLYIGGEGIASYQALYWTNNACPKAVAIIQPGISFSNNWTDFTVSDGYYYWVVANNPNGLMPKQIYFGGIMGREDYSYFDWPEYILKREIEQYYGSNKSGKGYVAIYENLNIL